MAWLSTGNPGSRIDGDRIERLWTKTAISISMSPDLQTNTTFFTSNSRPDSGSTTLRQRNGGPDAGERSDSEPKSIDLDNDGIDEIVVTNGHVGIFAPPLPPTRSHSRCFDVRPMAITDQLNSESWGGYFESPHVGRAFVHGRSQRRWPVRCSGHPCDRTGRGADECFGTVSIMSSRFRLVDREQCRDAIGAIVELEYGGRFPTNDTQRLFQLAGHGYLCGNEPLLWAGTGSSSAVRRMRVTWPDGTAADSDRGSRNGCHVLAGSR